MALTKIVNGVEVTNTNVKPPTGWTVKYEDFGSETEWGEDGEVANLVSAYGISGEVRPLFRTRYSGNEVIFIIEINSEYFIYDGQSGWVRRIVSPTDLREIVEFINEQGWFQLETEELG